MHCKLALSAVSILAISFGIEFSSEVAASFSKPGRSDSIAQDTVVVETADNNDGFSKRTLPR